MAGFPYFSTIRLAAIPVTPGDSFGSTKQVLFAAKVLADAPIDDALLP